MRDKKLLATLLPTFLCITPSFADSDAAPVDSPSSEIQSLRVERLEIAQRVATAYRQLFEQGDVSLVQLAEKQQLALDAALDLTTARAERITILEQAVSLHQKLYEYVQRQVEHAEAPQIALLEAKSELLAAQIALAVAKAD